MLILETALVFIVMICVLVTAHELGHFLLARWCGMAVEEFAVGMGSPRLLKVLGRKRLLPLSDDARRRLAERKGVPFEETPDAEVEQTIYALRPFPVGGFVRIKSMIPDTEGSEVAEPAGFYSKPAIQRLMVMLAGPVFSVLAGVIILFAYASIFGRVPAPGSYVDNLVTTGPAYKAGIRPGDRIIAVDGNTLPDYMALMRYVQVRANIPIQITFEHEGAQHTVSVTPILVKDSLVVDSSMEPTGDQADMGKILVIPKMAPMGVGRAVVYSVERPWFELRNLVHTLTNAKKAKESVGGPIAIVGATNMAVRAGLDVVLKLAGLLSIWVGTLNLFPIPPLDGGQIVVAIMEILRGGKRLSFKLQQMVYTAGAMVLLLLIVFVTVLDIQRNLTPKPVTEPVKPPDFAKPLDDQNSK